MCPHIFLAINMFMKSRQASMVPLGSVFTVMFSRPGIGTLTGGLPLLKIRPA